MRILVIIPAYNEALTVGSVVRGAVQTSVDGAETSVIVIDDGSTDQTARHAREAGAHVVSHSINQGLSRVFQKGVNMAVSGGFDILVTIDGDGQFDPGDIKYLVQPLLDQRADMVTASRFKDHALIPAMPRMKRWGNRIVAMLLSIVGGQRLADVSCGFRAYSHEALLQLNLFGRYTYTHETILNLMFKGLRITEVPLRIRGERQYGDSKIASSLWRYGYHIFNTIFRTMLDYRPLRFFGGGGIAVFIVGIIFDAFVLIHMLAVHQVTPYKTLGFIGMGLNIAGLLLVVVGLLADIINRARQTEERILYLLKQDIRRTQIQADVHTRHDILHHRN